MDVQIEPSWKAMLQKEFDKPYFERIVTYIKTEQALGKKIYPEGKNIFNAFNQTPFEKVRVVLLGQDPYHSVGQAMGLSFSVPKGVPLPPSLVNIFTEMNTDIGMTMPTTGDLTKYAAQGVLLLNAVLTVCENEAASHAIVGWTIFTDAVIKMIADNKKGVVFLLWGKFAQSKKALIDTNKHFILCAPHPSPLSAHRGFFGCKHFSKTNELLIQQGLAPIDWQP